MLRMPFKNVKTVIQPLPRSQMLRLDLLPCFDAAARTLSFTLAAQELNLTQSSCSKRAWAWRCSSVGTARSR